MSDRAYVYTPEWWECVRTISAQVLREGWDVSHLTNVGRQLELGGFDKVVVGDAKDWVERAALSGSLAEVLGMLHSTDTKARISTQSERLLLSEKMWLRIEDYRRSHLLSADLVERLLEALRVVDTRGWEDEDVQSFLSHMILTLFPLESDQTLERLYAGVHAKDYC